MTTYENEMGGSAMRGEETAQDFEERRRLTAEATGRFPEPPWEESRQAPGEAAGEPQRDTRPAGFGSQDPLTPNNRTPRIDTDTSIPDLRQQEERREREGINSQAPRDTGSARPPGRRQERYRNERPTWQHLDHVGRLSTSSSGWTREVNIVSWNGAAPRLDIRDWSPDRMKMSRGVGLNREETENLRALLNGFDPRRAGI